MTRDQSICFDDEKDMAKPILDDELWAGSSSVNSPFAHFVKGS